MSAAAVTPPGFLGALGAVLRNELRLAFLSPVAWVFLSAVLVLGGAFFSLGLALDGEASLRATTPNLAVTLLFCLPILTMRQLSEESRSGTLELLMTAPVPLGALILGKWLASLALCGALLVATGTYAVVLTVYGDPDPGALLTSYLGLLACCAAFSAAGLFASSLTRDPMVAGLLGVLFLAPLWLAGAAQGFVPEAVEPFVARLSLFEHLRSFSRGVVDTGDLAWFAGVTGVFLFFTWRSLESRRWR